MRLSSLLALVLAAPVLAAPVPAEEKPKPRPKLLGTLKLNKAVEQAVWTPDAKHLILVVDGKGLVVSREQLGEDAPPKPAGEFDLPVNGGLEFGFTPDGGELYAVAAAGFRFNAESRLCFWSLKDLLDGKKKAKPDRVVSLEADNPSGTTLAADGRSVYAVVSEPRPGAGAVNGITPAVGKVLRLSARTGDVADELLALDHKDGTLVGAAVHPESGRVVAHFQVGEEHVLRGYDLPTKKVRWEKKYEQAPPNGGSSLTPRLSPDGKVVVVFCARQFQMPPPGFVPQPGQPVPVNTVVAVSPRLLDAGSGAEVGDLGGDDVTFAGAGGFSSDGRLLFGYLQRNSGVQHVVWDARTGKPLKTWNRGTSNITTAFAPGRHELLSVERTDTPVFAPQRQRVWGDLLSSDILLKDSIQISPVQEVVRTDTVSIVGVWDLSPLAK